MGNEIIVAIIALAGTILGVLIGCISSSFVLRFNYKQLYTQTISSNRMEWITICRENLSIFLANAKILHRLYNQDKVETEEFLALEQELLKAREMIMIRLNLEDSRYKEGHNKLYNTLLKFDFYNLSEEEFILQCTEIRDITKSILKVEWERVKFEAKDKKA